MFIIFLAGDCSTFFINCLPRRRDDVLKLQSRNLTTWCGNWKLIKPVLHIVVILVYTIQRNVTQKQHGVDEDSNSTAVQTKLLSASAMQYKTKTKDKIVTLTYHTQVKHIEPIRLW